MKPCRTKWMNIELWQCWGLTHLCAFALWAVAIALQWDTNMCSLMTPKDESISPCIHGTSDIMSVEHSQETSDHSQIQLTFQSPVWELPRTFSKPQLKCKPVPAVTQGPYVCRQGAQMKGMKQEWKAWGMMPAYIVLCNIQYHAISLSKLCCRLYITWLFSNEPQPKHTGCNLISCRPIAIW